MARRIQALVAAGAFLGLGGACAQEVGAGPQAVDVMNRSVAAAFIMSKSVSPNTGDYGVGSVLNELHGPVGRAVKRVTASEVTGSAASRRTAMLSGAAPERSRASAGAKVFHPADHADLPGSGHRRAAAGADRIR